MRYCSFFLLLFIVSCSGSGTSDEKKKPSHKNDILLEKNRRPDVVPKASSSSSKRIVIVLAEHGTNLHKRPDGKSPVVIRVNYGQKLELISSAGKWFGINCTDNSTNSHFSLEGRAVVYVNKADVAADTNFPLSNADLNRFDLNYQEGYYTGDSSSHAIKVSLVSKGQFYQARKLSVSYFTADTSLENKKKHLMLYKTYGKENQNDEDSNYKFTYIGQIKCLSWGVVRRDYLGDYGDDPLEDELDGQAFILTDLQTGKELKSLGSFPYLSQDKRFLMSFRRYVFLNRSAVAITDLAADKVYWSEIFDRWVITDESLMFWGSDGCFYLAVLPGVLIDGEFDGPEKYTKNEALYKYVKIQIPPLSTFKKL